MKDPEISACIELIHFVILSCTARRKTGRPPRIHGLLLCLYLLVNLFTAKSHVHLLTPPPGWKLPLPLPIYKSIYLLTEILLGLYEAHPLNQFQSYQYHSFTRKFRSCKAKVPRNSNCNHTIDTDWTLPAILSKCFCCCVMVALYVMVC